MGGVNWGYTAVTQALNINWLQSSHAVLLKKRMESISFRSIDYSDYSCVLCRRKQLVTCN